MWRGQGTHKASFDTSCSTGKDSSHTVYKDTDTENSDKPYNKHMGTFRNVDMVHPHLGRWSVPSRADLQPQRP